MFSPLRSDSPQHKNCLVRSEFSHFGLRFVAGFVRSRFSGFSSAHRGTFCVVSEVKWLSKRVLLVCESGV